MQLNVHVNAKRAAGSGAYQSLDGVHYLIEMIKSIVINYQKTNVLNQLHHIVTTSVIRLFPQSCKKNCMALGAGRMQFSQ